MVFPGGVDTGIAQHSGVAIPGDGRRTRRPGREHDERPRGGPADRRQGIEKGSYRVVIGKDARGLDRLSRFSPQRATDLIAKKMASLLER